MLRHEPHPQAGIRALEVHVSMQKQASTNYTPPKLLGNSYEQKPKLLNGVYIGDYIGEYYRCYYGGY